MLSGFKQAAQLDAQHSGSTHCIFFLESKYLEKTHGVEELRSEIKKNA
jgi:hypothetical protein